MKRDGGMFILLHGDTLLSSNTDLRSCVLCVYVCTSACLSCVCVCVEYFSVSARAFCGRTEKIVFTSRAKTPDFAERDRTKTHNSKVQPTRISRFLGALEPNAKWGRREYRIPNEPPQIVWSVSQLEKDVCVYVCVREYASAFVLDFVCVCVCWRDMCWRVFVNSYISCANVCAACTRYMGYAKFILK